jgi:hypothetical protein
VVPYTVSAVDIVEGMHAWRDDHRSQLRRDYVCARTRLYGALSVRLEDDTLLRKARSGQSSRMRRQMQRLRAEAENQLSGAARFAGDVSVDILVVAGEDRQPPQAPDVVKAYIDLLNGLAYADDRQIAHLTVHRLARDDPALVAGAQRFGDRQWGAHSALAQPSVFITVEPVVWYVEAFDRARRRAAERDSSSLDDDGPELPRSPWETQWDESDDIELIEREDELRRTAKLDHQFAQHIREFKLVELQRLRTRFLLDTYLSAADRPGPLPEDVRRTLDELPMAADTFFHRLWPGGVFHLPLPTAAGSSAGWRSSLRAAIASEQERWQSFRPSRDARLALDIALRASDASGKDLDNLAHDVLVGFEETYCDGRRGTVVAYRAYRAEGPQPDLRVLVMAIERLRALDEHIEAAQREAIRRWERM